MHPGIIFSEFKINYVAVAVAAVVPIIIGALWYSPLLFGGLCANAHGYTDERLRELAGRSLKVAPFCYLLMAFVFALLVSYTGVSTARQGTCLGLLVWIGFLATLGLTAHVYSGKPLTIFFADAGFQLVYAMAMGAILAAWR